jgi:hypothetical protein
MSDPHAASNWVDVINFLVGLIPAIDIPPLGIPSDHHERRYDDDDDDPFRFSPLHMPAFRVDSD